MHGNEAYRHLQTLGLYYVYVSFRKMFTSKFFKTTLVRMILCIAQNKTILNFRCKVRLFEKILKFC